MQVIRIYTGDDEQTHFEELDVEAFRAIATNPGEGPIGCNPGPGEFFHRSSGFRRRCHQS